MADNIVSVHNFDDLFADLITQCSGLDSNKVLISYSEKGQVSSSINDNVCYIHTEHVSDYVDQYKNRKEVFNNQTGKTSIFQSSMRVLELRITFYGPQSDVLGVKVKEKLYLDSSKQFLYKINLALIPEKDTIMKTHELINDRWWDRVDVTLFFYNSVTIEEIVDVVVNPVINIVNDMEV